MRAKRPYIVLSFRTTVDAMAWEKDWQCWRECFDPAAYDAVAQVEQ